MVYPTTEAPHEVSKCSPQVLATKAAFREPGAVGRPFGISSSRFKTSETTMYHDRIRVRNSDRPNHGQLEERRSSLQLPLPPGDRPGKLTLSPPQREEPPPRYRASELPAAIGVSRPRPHSNSSPSQFKLPRRSGARFRPSTAQGVQNCFATLPTARNSRSATTASDTSSIRSALMTSTNGETCDSEASPKVAAGF